MDQYPQQYQYIPAQPYGPQSWAAVINAAVGIAMLVSIGVFVFSQIKGAMKGEEVKSPLGSRYES